MEIYVWRFTDDPVEFAMEHNELIRYGILRQGWGSEGLDLTKGFSNFESNWPAAWLVGDADRHFNMLKPLLDIQKGDLVIVPDVTVSYDTYNTHGFTLLRCVEPYQFVEPLTVKRGEDTTTDYGHSIKVNVVYSCDYFDPWGKIGRKLRGYRDRITKVDKESQKEFVDAISFLGL